MSKICTNCNFENNDQNMYCENCGNVLSNIEQKEKYRGASLTWGILSIFLGFITSIIGIVYGILYRGKYGKVCGGYILSLSTFIIKLFVYPLIIYAVITFVLPFWVLTK